MAKINFIGKFLTILVLGFILNSCSSEGSTASCPKIKNAFFVARPTSISINFEKTDEANSYLIESGITGFTPGSGTVITTSNQNLDIPDLNPSTTYDVYITSICSASEHSEAYKMSSITTDSSQCTGTATLQITQYNVNSLELNCGYNNSSPEKYEIEYGLHGFTIGSGTKIATLDNQSTVIVNNIQTSTKYDFYVRAVCYQTDVSAYTKVEYTTESSCPKPVNLNSFNISGSCNSGLGETRGFSWSYSYSAPTSYTICIVEGNNAPSASGNVFTTSNNSISLSGMYCLWDAFYVRANCTDGSSSEWAGPFYF